GREAVQGGNERPGPRDTLLGRSMAVPRGPRRRAPGRLSGHASSGSGPCDRYVPHPSAFHRLVNQASLRKNVQVRFDVPLLDLRAEPRVEIGRAACRVREKGREGGGGGWC